MQGGMNDRHRPNLEIKGKRSEPLPLLGGEGLLGMSNAITDSFLELVIVEIHQRVGIVVADHSGLAALSDEPQALRRSGSIPHDISQAEDLLDALLIDVGKDCLERIDVGMDVTDDGEEAGGG